MSQAGRPCPLAGASSRPQSYRSAQLNLLRHDEELLAGGLSPCAMPVQWPSTDMARHSCAIGHQFDTAHLKGS
jgi:hypothetical protein